MAVPARRSRGAARRSRARSAPIRAGAHTRVELAALAHAAIGQLEARRSRSGARTVVEDVAARGDRGDRALVLDRGNDAAGRARAVLDRDRAHGRGSERARYRAVAADHARRLAARDRHRDRCRVARGRSAPARAARSPRRAGQGPSRRRARIARDSPARSPPSSCAMASTPRPRSSTRELADDPNIGAPGGAPSHRALWRRARRGRRATTAPPRSPRAARWSRPMRRS